MHILYFAANETVPLRLKFKPSNATTQISLKANFAQYAQNKPVFKETSHIYMV